MKLPTLLLKALILVALLSPWQCKASELERFNHYKKYADINIAADSAAIRNNFMLERCNGKAVWMDKNKQKIQHLYIVITEDIGGKTVEWRIESTNDHVMWNTDLNQWCVHCKQQVPFGNMPRLEKWLPMNILHVQQTTRRMLPPMTSWTYDEGPPLSADAVVAGPPQGPPPSWNFPTFEQGAKIGTLTQVRTQKGERTVKGWSFEFGYQDGNSLMRYISQTPGFKYLIENKDRVIIDKPYLQPFKVEKVFKSQDLFPWYFKQPDHEKRVFPHKVGQGLFPWYFKQPDHEKRVFPHKVGDVVFISIKFCESDEPNQLVVKLI